MPENTTACSKEYAPKHSTVTPLKVNEPIPQKKQDAGEFGEARMKRFEAEINRLQDECNRLIAEIKYKDLEYEHQTAEIELKASKKIADLTCKIRERDARIQRLEHALANAYVGSI